jgi:hypothetical protein
VTNKYGTTGREKVRVSEISTGTYTFDTPGIFIQIHPHMYLEQIVAG